MKTAETRIQVCVVCLANLPTGSRRDRKYCREACSERAYYQRHPNKKRVLTARTRTRAEADTRTLLRAGELTKKAAQLEIENASLRRDLKAARAKLADRNAANDNTLSQAQARNAKMAPTLEAATQKIKTLQAQVQQANQDVRISDQALIDANERIAKLEEQLRAATSRAQRAENAHESRRPQTTTKQGPPRSQSYVEIARRDWSEPLPPATALERRVAQPVSTRNSFVQHPKTQNAAVRVHDPLPWERPGRNIGDPPVFKWMGWPWELAEKLKIFTDATLLGLPTEIYKQGDRSVAKMMRSWLEAPGNLEDLKEISFRIAVLTACTERSERRTISQKQSLAKLVWAGAISTLEIDMPRLGRQMKALPEDQSWFYERFAYELVQACHDKELRYDEQNDCWRLSNL